MKNSTISKPWSYLIDLVSTDAAKSRKRSTLWLMLFTLLLVPTRMVAQTTTEDPRCALFKLDGITDVTITDNGDYPWKMLYLNAEGMGDLGFTFPDESKVLMSSNYHMNKSSSETVVNFKVTKRILLTFKNLVSSDYYDRATVTLDNKEYGNISGKNQIEEVKALLPIGEHSLKLSYKKDISGSFYADRAFIYDLNTATNISDYVAEFNATNQTLTFKKISSDNLENLDFKNIVIANNEPTVKDVCTRLGIDKRTIKSVIFDKSFNEYALTSLKGFFQECGNLETISGLDYLNTENVTDMSNMFNNCIILPSLDLSNFNTAKVTNMSCMFKNCKELSSLNLSESFNTVNVTNMSSMFYGCSQLSSLDLSNFNTEKVKFMPSMFYGCNKLSSLDLSNFNTENVTDMSYMFSGCQKLSSLTLSESFNTVNVTNMLSMFRSCQELSSLNLSNFNTAKVTKMSCMFYKCQKLPSLDLSNFNTAKVKDMSSMFSGCIKLSSLTLSESFNTVNVTNMSTMFNGCSQLSSLDLSNFNTENVTKMYDMFKNCNNLSSLDLYNFNTAKVTDMSYMFYGCSTLQTIYVSDDFVVTGITNDSYKKNLFTNCNALPAFDATKTSSDYANYKTGYFTKLVVRNGDERYGIKGETTQLTVDNLALDDNKDLVAYEPFVAKAASYSRLMKEGTTWATLCLPFEVSLDGQNFRAFKLLSADEGTETVELEEIKTNIEAGTPVIIKMNEEATSLNFSVADKAIANEVKTTATSDGNYQLQGTYTQKVFDKTADNNCYFVKGDKLMNPSKLSEGASMETVHSEPFRAYMVDLSSAPAAGAKMFSIGISGDPAAIDHLNVVVDSKAVFYDLQGNRLNAPQKGINIVKRGGKTMKVVIR
ncbi:MAG TPA: hypothetical protein DEQ66_00390 [Prevotella sp.]|nr:hypothetical protein [Prevotella sp.]